MRFRFPVACCLAAWVAISGVASAQPAVRIGFVSFDNDPMPAPTQCLTIFCNGLMFCVPLAMPLTDDDVRNQVANYLSAPSDPNGQHLSVMRLGDTSLLITEAFRSTNGSAEPLTSLEVISGTLSNVVVLDALVPVPALFIDLDESGNLLDGTRGPSTFAIFATADVTANFDLSGCTNCTDNEVADALDDRVQGAQNFALIRNGYGPGGSSGMIITGLSLTAPVTNGGSTMDPNNPTPIGGFGFVPPSIQNLDPTTMSATGGGMLCVQGGGYDSNSPRTQLFVGGVNITADPNNLVFIDRDTIKVNIPPDGSRVPGRVDLEVRNSNGLSHRLFQQFDFVSSPNADLCRTGNVHRVATDCITDVLFVNGTSGRPTREVIVPAGTIASIELNTPLITPTDPATTAGFMLYAWGGAPASGTSFTETFGAETFGSMCRRTPLNPGPGQPAKSFAFDSMPGGTPLFPPGFASAHHRVFNVGTPFRMGKRLNRAGAVFYLQGFVEDDTAPTTRKLSITNGIVIRVQ
ncbi:MAG: IPT/TIG domain-containing protein [Planctomycetes bacterium]|nr:IPT/TIG domain-containing protein [Planctomycetota bacterium]